MKILIVKLSAIGDVIHTLPALNAIRDQYPDAHITWLVEEAAADLVVGSSTMRIFSSAKKRRPVRRRISRTAASLDCFLLPDMDTPMGLLRPQSVS